MLTTCTLLPRTFIQVVTSAGNVDGKLAAFVMSYVIVTNWVILQVFSEVQRELQAIASFLRKT
jgi:hypothetical protein